ncbi:hypothetical protein L2E82_25598 [Cichorium intybus]|uniref:Uncharacterized protein n=1 Tax=Cichorium intybus TaxID=13427 RepID=A0ACB9E4Q0_CICIN|nr:hypothetical protein L2E82_25598 [Cichorium intybus]
MFISMRQMMLIQLMAQSSRMDSPRQELGRLLPWLERSRDLKEIEGVNVVGVQQIDQVVDETLKGHEVRLLTCKTLPALNLPMVGRFKSVVDGVKEIWLSSEDTGHTVLISYPFFFLELCTLTLVYETMLFVVMIKKNIRLFGYAESLVILASSLDLRLRATDDMLVDGEACTLSQLEFCCDEARSILKNFKVINVKAIDDPNKAMRRLHPANATRLMLFRTVGRILSYPHVHLMKLTNIDHDLSLEEA